MDKETLIPQGFYKAGRDIPAGVYLITSLADGGFISVRKGGERQNYESFFLNEETSLSCQIEVGKGDEVSLEGKIKIKRIGDFPYAMTAETEVKTETKATVPKKYTSIDYSSIKMKWEENISKYYAVYRNGNNRLTRGLEYFSQGRVEDLLYGKGIAKAFVKGSDKFSYEVSIYIKKANPSDDIMPTKEQISFECDCPDPTKPCKHIAAVLYSISNDLEQNPYILNLLRDKSV